MKNQYPDLAKQVVFITGAASGIGAAQARAFLEQDAFVFGLDQKFGKMEELSLRFPETFAYALGDVRQMKELQQAVSKCQDRFGEVTILLNTSGILDAYKPLMETDESLWDLIYETNVKSMYQLTKIILPDMIRRKAEQSSTWLRLRVWLLAEVGSLIQVRNMQSSDLPNNSLWITQDRVSE